MTDNLLVGGLDQRFLDILVKIKQIKHRAKQVRWRIRNASAAPKPSGLLASEADFRHPCGPRTSSAGELVGNAELQSPPQANQNLILTNPQVSWVHWEALPSPFITCLADQRTPVLGLQRNTGSRPCSDTYWWCDFGDVSSLLWPSFSQRLIGVQPNGLNDAPVF